MALSTHLCLLIIVFLRHSVLYAVLPKIGYQDVAAEHRLLHKYTLLLDYRFSSILRM